jgi:hypothetical protein
MHILQALEIQARLDRVVLDRVVLEHHFNLVTVVTFSAIFIIEFGSRLNSRIYTIDVRPIVGL